MAIGLKDLLKYKKDVEIKDAKDKVVAKVWVRLLGDEDLNLSLKIARVASLAKRNTLLDPSSLDYKDEIEELGDFSRADLEGMIIQARQNQFMNEAFVKVNREELVKIEEIAEEPDAPTLPEQEQLDKKLEEQNEDYRKRLDEYVADRVEELKGTLAAQTDEEIVAAAKQNMANILPLQTFFNELNAQKAFRGTYDDRECKKRSFADEDEFTNAAPLIKQQLIAAYAELELNPDDIKN